MKTEQDYLDWLKTNKGKAFLKRDRVASPTFEKKWQEIFEREVARGII